MVFGYLKKRDSWPYLTKLLVVTNKSDMLGCFAVNFHKFWLAKRIGLFSCYPPLGKPISAYPKRVPIFQGVVALTTLTFLVWLLLTFEQDNPPTIAVGSFLVLHFVVEFFFGKHLRDSKGPLRNNPLTMYFIYFYAVVFHNLVLLLGGVVVFGFCTYVFGYKRFHLQLFNNSVLVLLGMIAYVGYAGKVLFSTSDAIVNAFATAVVVSFTVVFLNQSIMIAMIKLSSRKPLVGIVKGVMTKDQLLGKIFDFLFGLVYLAFVSLEPLVFLPLLLLLVVTTLQEELVNNQRQTNEERIKLQLDLLGNPTFASDLYLQNMKESLLAEDFDIHQVQHDLDGLQDQVDKIKTILKTTKKQLK